MGGWWSIENPLSGLFWHMPEVRGLGRRALRIRFDACRHGVCCLCEGPIMKPTALLTNAAWLRPL
eukprot:11212743-Lingulodinium_polyedra.AAC.1